jgi:hypothetical protein
VEIGDDGGGVARELRGGVVVGRIGDVDQMMWNAAALSNGHFVGADVEPAEHRG